MIFEVMFAKKLITSLKLDFKRFSIVYIKVGSSVMLPKISSFIYL